jgi:hypothetical protein
MYGKEIFHGIALTVQQALTEVGLSITKFLLPMPFRRTKKFSYDVYTFEKRAVGPHLNKDLFVTKEQQESITIFFDVFR